MVPAPIRIRLSKGIILDYTSKAVKSVGFRCWVGGESGSGKTTVASSILEQIVRQGGQVLLFDAHGEYGNLWAAAPARVVRIGYGDEPVSEESLEWCLQVLRENKSLLLDFSHWTDLYPQKLDAFVLQLIRDFYELRRKHPKQSLIAVEEASNFAPQMQGPGQAENVRTFIRVTTGGRKFGVNVLFTTQRQSMVDSNVIGNCNVRIFMRTSEFNEWKRVRRYIPEDLGISYDGGWGIRGFKEGEAVVLTPWTPDAKVQLAMPSVEIGRKF